MYLVLLHDCGIPMLVWICLEMRCVSTNMCQFYACNFDKDFESLRDKDHRRHRIPMCYDIVLLYDMGSNEAFHLGIMARYGQSIVLIVFFCGDS